MNDSITRFPNAENVKKTQLKRIALDGRKIYANILSNSIANAGRHFFARCGALFLLLALRLPGSIINHTE